LNGTERRREGERERRREGEKERRREGEKERRRDGDKMFSHRSSTSPSLPPSVS
jgi:hypothetical protein